jgi:hypothetical protein
MKKIALTILVLALAMTAMAADVSGDWSGAFIPEGMETGTAYLKLKQSGATLSGTAGPSADEQWPITNGKVDGNTLTGVTTSPEGVAYKFTLTMTTGGDHITGNVEVSSGGQSIKAKLDVKRVTQ